MTVGETKRPATLANKNSVADNNKTSRNESAQASDVKRRDVMSFSEDFHNIEGVSPLLSFPIDGLKANNAEVKLEPGSSGAAQILASQVAEDPSATLLCNTIIQKMLRDPALQNMAFSIQNKHGHVNVEAMLNNGHMRCTLSTSSEKLKRRLNDARQQIISSLGKNLRRQIELDIKE